MCIRDSYKGKTILDISESEFMAPWAFALFTAYGLNINNKIPGSFILKTGNNVASRHAARMGMCRVFGVQSEYEEGFFSHCVPITIVKESRDIAKFANNAVELLEIEDREIEDAVKYSIVELLRNVVQHSGSEIGGFVWRSIIQVVRRLKYVLRIWVLVFLLHCPLDMVD